MKRPQTRSARPRRRTRSGLPVAGALPPREPRVLHRRHTRVWLGLSLTLLLIVGGTVAWQLLHSSYLEVQSVQISGMRRVDRAAVLQAAGVLGQPIYAVSPAQVQASIEKLALVHTASVRRIWPHTVRIAITERQPWGTWEIGGVNYLVDRNGLVLDVVSAPAHFAIYELDGAAGLQPGDRVDADAIAAAQRVIEELPNVVSQRVDKVEYSSESGLEILTNTGVRARLGDSQGLDYKLAVWQAVTAKAGAAGVHTIDLRFGNRPSYR